MQHHGGATPSAPPFPWSTAAMTSPYHTTLSPAPPISAYHTPLLQQQPITIQSPSSSSFADIEQLRLQIRSLESSSSYAKQELSSAELRRTQAEQQVMRLTNELQEARSVAEERQNTIQSLRQRETENRNSIASLEHEVRMLKQYQDQIRQQVEHEKKLGVDNLEKQREQHERALRSSNEDKLQMEQKKSERIAELDRTIARLHDERDGDRDALLGAEKTRRTQDDNIASLREELRRKDELISMHEREGKIKQERVDEALKLVAALQADLTATANENKHLMADLESRLKEKEALRTEHDSLTASLKGEQRSIDKWRSAYSEVGRVLGANASDISSASVDIVANRIIKEIEQLRTESTRVKIDLNTERASAEREKLRVAQLMLERDNAFETAAVKDDEVAAMKEHLLTTTSTLRSEARAAHTMPLVPVGIATLPRLASTNTTTHQWASLSRSYVRPSGYGSSARSHIFR